MLSPISSYPLLTESISEEVVIPPGSNVQPLFEKWKANKVSSGPKFCDTHKRMGIVLSRTRTRASAAYDEDGKERRDACSFRIAWICPICVSVRAQCPPEFHATSFETFKTTTPQLSNALEQCKAFAAQVQDNGRGFALFVGPPGTGKTRLASNVVSALECVPALYTRQGQLTTALRASYRQRDVVLRRERNQDQEDSMIHEEDSSSWSVPRDIRLLVLDEIGCVPLANDERLMLDELLKHRYDHGSPTILISNLPLNQLKLFLGDALTDRIKHATGNGKFILQFDGGSYRRTSKDDYLSPRSY